MGLPGVKVGPLDPDRTADFGQVSAKNSARSLIRLHAQAYPTVLVQALARKLDVPRTEGLDMDEVRDYLGGLKLENGDPAVPTGSEIVGASVRGERDRPQLLTYTFRLNETGRTGKWFTDYSEEGLPASFADGTDRVRIEDLRKRGVVATEAGAPGGTASNGPSAAETKLARENAALQRRIDELQAAAQEPASIDDALAEDGAEDGADDDLLPEDEPAAAAEDDNDDADDGAGESVAAQEPPFADYDETKAAELVKLIKADDTSDDERQAILDYEKTHQNRRSVVGAAEVKLGDRGAA